MLNKVILRNFLSWSELEFDINSGISLIDGWNYDDNTAEGSGKSAIFNAVSWCLFGKLPKDTKIDDIIKDGETSCQVVLIFDNDKYRVIRSRKPNDLYIVNVETQQKIKGKDAKETQTLIEEFVGLSFESFCQSIYFAQNYDKKFITSNNEEKGKILSEIQDLNIFDKARKNTLELIKLEESTHATLTKNLELKRNEVEYTKQLIISEERNYQLQLDNIANRRIYLESKKNEATLKTDALLESMRIKEKELSNKLSLIDNMNVDILRSDKDNLLAELSKLELARSSIETNKRSLDKKKREIENILNSIKLISTKKARLEEYAKNDNKKCPTCGSDVNNFDPITHQQEVDLLDKELANYVENLSIVDVEMEAYRNTLASSDESSFNLKRTEIQEQMSILTKSISAHETNISNAEFLRFQIKQIVDSCNTSVNEVAKLHLELERLNEQSLVIDESID
jgi:DNA repair exonuclease SbcCD ATPase subunit